MEECLNSKVIPLKYKTINLKMKL